MNGKHSSKAHPVGMIGRPHYCPNDGQSGYVKSPQQAFDLYLGDKARCHVSGCFIRVEEAISLIHDAGGYAVLAHHTPHSST